MALRKKKSGTEKRKRSPIIGFRATDGEREKIEAAADREGLTVGSYVRARALSQPTTRAVRRPPVNAAVLAKISGQLGKGFGNLYQVLRHLNFNDQPVLAEEVREAMQDIRMASRAVIEALGNPTP